MKPRQFWTTADVRRADGTEEVWHLAAVAHRGMYGSYNIEVEVRRYVGGAFKRRWMETDQIYKDEALPVHRNWTFFSQPLTRPDGYEFDTLSQAMWTFMDKVFIKALESTLDPYQLIHHVNGDKVADHAERNRKARPLYQIVSYAESPVYNLLRS